MKKLKQSCNIESCMLCSSCLEAWLPALEQHRISYAVKKGEVIFKEGDPVAGVFFVTSGNIKVHKSWGADKELIVRFATKGSIVGHRGLGKSLHYPVTGTAMEDGTLCYVNLAFFETTLVVNHDFTLKLMKFFAQELQESERNMRNLAHMPVKGRVAQALISLRSQFGLTPTGSINIQLTRQDLASCAGATYETVFRTMNEMTSEQIIEAKGKNIVILNEAKLVALTSQGN